MSVAAIAGLILDASLNDKHSVYWLFLFITISSATLIVCTICFLHKKLRVAALLLVSFAHVCAIYFSLMWELHATSSIVLGFTILLSGIFFGSKAILPAAALSVITFFLLYGAGVATSNSSIQPSYASLYALFLAAFSVIGWLSSAHTERIIQQLINTQTALRQRGSSMRRQLLSEYALTRKRQAEELMTIYQFAAVGRNTAAILHDLANELSTLSLSLRDSNPAALENGDIQRSLSEIESLIASAHDSIRPVEPEPIDACRLVRERWTKRFRAMASAQHADIELVGFANEPCIILGDRRQLLQVLDILVQNAIEAYHVRSRKKRLVQLIVQREDGLIEIAVKDFGVGITPERRKHLFKQPKSYKQNGHGIGLYIARQIIRHHFHGDLTLDDSPDYTMFVMRFPAIRAPLPLATGDIRLEQQ